MPNRAARPITFTDLRNLSGMNGSGSKSCTSPATRIGWLDASNERIGPTPLCPSTHACQKASLPTPLGATTPTPVITTLRMTIPRSAAPGPRP